MMRSNCGTDAGYQAHQKMRETPCDPCRDARRDYMRRYRRHNPDARQYDRDQNEAYTRAERELRARHEDEFRAIYAALRMEYPTLARADEGVTA